MAQIKPKSIFQPIFYTANIQVHELLALLTVKPDFKLLFKAL